MHLHFLRQIKARFSPIRQLLSGQLLCGIALCAMLPLVTPLLAEEKKEEKPEPKKTEAEEYYELMSVFVDTFEKIERNYVEEVDRRKILEAAIRGMAEELDQYTTYISNDQIQRFNQMVEQEFGGIGIQIDIDKTTDRLRVATPLPGTPAYKAGVQAGDLILKINDESTVGYKIEDAVKKLKGKAGESVTISVKHPDTEMPVDITIMREVIRVSTVLGLEYNDDATWNFWLDQKEKIGYIRLTHFSRHSAEELREVIDQLVLEGMRGLILDLRFNPGGLLSQATEIADMFIESGRIVSTKGRNTPERTWDAQSEGTYNGFPMAILVNHYSASASEIVSACLQDHDRAVVVGDRTWGKGSVQNVFDLEEGNSALKLTTASYHRPSGKNIHRMKDAKPEDDWGVMPSEGYKLKFTNEQIRAYDLYRKKRDVIGVKLAESELFDDTQLNKAAEYVREKLKPAPEKKPEPVAQKVQ